ncbi:hypothetical protein HAX54_002759 [Datura stramonium]|uniref:Uncharacterized protein n=1 Tax=Datura stramonium TaxID=4076 RepID=A0ABS8WW53_DATST|nr:hypothetical protein [Datura stramonium]
MTFNFLRERLGNDHEFKSFLNIMSMHRKKGKGIKQVYQEDLLDEFNFGFLPVGTIDLSNRPDDKSKKHVLKKTIGTGRSHDEDPKDGKGEVPPRKVSLM